MSNVEIELKLEFDPGDLAVLHRAPFLAGAGETHHLVATYFDTPDRALDRSKYSLRIRRHGQQCIQTVKAGGGAAAGLFARDEWERKVDGDTPVLDAASGPLLDAIGGEAAARLAPMLVTDVERRSWQLEFEGAEMELSVDRGTVRAGNRTAALAEVELELRGGDTPALFDVARQIDGHVPLRLAVRSKSERGYALLDGALSRPVKAEPVVLDRAMRAADALRAIVSACIRHYRLNETLLLQSDNAEALHQARVALRRLRSALSLFRPLLRDDPDAELLNAQLRRFAGALGKARNLDVLIAHMGKDVPPALDQARARAYAHVRTELESARVRLLMLDLVEWLSNGPWLREPRHPKRLGTPIAFFAAKRLSRGRRRLEQLGQDIAHRGAKQSHRVRIEAKKARYAAEFFATLWLSPDGRQRHATWLKGLERVQDRLGALNDLVIGQRILADLGVEAGLERPDTARAESLRADAGAALEKLAKTPSFWTD